MNRSVVEVGGAVLVVSQFTLYGDVAAAGGRRSSARSSRRAPSASTSGRRRAARRGLPVATGVFGADMHVELVNDGPVTLLIDSTKAF